MFEILNQHVFRILMWTCDGDVFPVSEEQPQLKLGQRTVSPCVRDAGIWAGQKQHRSLKKWLMTKHIRCVRGLQASHLKIMVKQGRQEYMDPDMEETAVRSHGQGWQEGSLSIHNTLKKKISIFIFYADRRKMVES